jgi:hypothetical protein
MVRVIKTGDTARVVLEDRAPETDDVDALVAGVWRCAHAGIEELLIAVPTQDPTWLEILQEALADTPDPLRIWVSLGEKVGSG